MRREFPTRWSAAAVAVALTLPANARSGRAEWIELLDALDDAIDFVLWH